ncbi:MAG: hypothetical protein KF905_15010 [Flavobacteriales bacterium]|nr:hypothetical protein [Flavobacteriales bacterium]
MSKKAIKNKAKELLGYGLSKQQTYDLLMSEFPEAKPKKVAEELRYMPTLQAKAQYRELHRLLLAGIVLLAAIRVVPVLVDVDFAWERSYRLVGLVPFASLLLGSSIWRWQGQVFQWVGWMNVIGVGATIKALTELYNGNGNGMQAAQSAVSVGIGALALYLAYRVFAKPKVDKDPLGGPDRVVFQEEGTM